MFEKLRVPVIFRPWVFLVLLSLHVQVPNPPPFANPLVAERAFRASEHMGSDEGVGGAWEMTGICRHF